MLTVSELKAIRTEMATTIPVIGVPEDIGYAHPIVMKILDRVQAAVLGAAPTADGETVSVFIAPPPGLTETAGRRLIVDCIRAAFIRLFDLGYHPSADADVNIYEERQGLPTGFEVQGWRFTETICWNDVPQRTAWRVPSVVKTQYHVSPGAGTFEAAGLKMTRQIAASQATDTARLITTHRGPGLCFVNNSLQVLACGERSAGNANTEYCITGVPGSGLSSFADLPATVRFQDGDPDKVGITGGTNEALLAVLIDRLEGFQSGKFACPENAEALDHINKALAALHRRTAERVRRSVAGKLTP